MPRALLLWPVVLLAAGAAWSQGGAGGDDDAALAAARPAAVAEPLTLHGLAAAQGVQPRDAAPAEGAAHDAQDDEELEIVENPPEDPVETGVSTLVVTLRDEQGGPPACIDLELWRLGAPQNAHWLEGDQLQAQAAVKEARVEWTGLPEGTYRLFTGDARVGAADPPAFQVTGAVSAVEATLALPRDVPVFVRVFDEGGVPLKEGLRSVLGGSSHGTHAEPAWRRKRALRRGAPAEVFWFSRGCGGGGERARPVQAGAEGFALGRAHESTKAESSSWSGELTFAGRTSVTAHVDSCDVKHPEPTRYVAISVPLEAVVAGVWTPDGRRALEAGARIEADCQAVRVPRDAEAPDARTLPIRVTVRLAGCEPLTFTTTSGERAATRTLVRAATVPESAR